MEKKWWTLLIVCLGTFMLLLDVTIVNVALPDIQSSLNAGFSDLQWVVDAYALSLASLLLTTGSLADLFGRRLLFEIGLVVFTIGSLFCGVATSPLFIVLSRAGQGVGGAAMFSTSLALLASAFHGRDRGIAFATWGGITGVAVAIGPVLGGLLTSGLSWRWIFYVNVPVGVLAFAVTLTRVQESREAHARRPDWAGFVTFTGALCALVYGLIRAAQDGWGDAGVLTCFAIAAVGLVMFLILEAARRDPMFDLSLFRKPTFSGGSVAAFGLSASIFSMLLYLVIYLQDQQRFSALGTGVRLLVLSGSILVTAVIAGRLSSHVPVRWLIGPGLVLVGVGLLLMHGVTGRSSWTHLIPGFIVSGLGTGLVNPPLASTAVGVVEPRRAGMASGISSTFRQVGIATGIAALGTIFATQLTNHVRSGLHDQPQLAARSSDISLLIRNGQASRAIGLAPPQLRAHLKAVVQSSFASGLNDILLIAGIVALVAGAISALTIRSRDFAEGSRQHQHNQAQRSPGEVTVPHAGT